MNIKHLLESHSISKHAIIFSDIDGTFWDESYRHPFSEEFLKMVFSRYDVVFASSRTIPEMLAFQRSIGCRAPFIAENGGVVVFYADSYSENLHSENSHSEKHIDTDTTVETIEPLQPPRNYAITISGEQLLLVPLGVNAINVFPFVKFAMADAGVYAEHSRQMPTETLARIGSYDMEDAQRAQVRQFSVAISVEKLTTEQIQRLVSSLKRFYCRVSSGGKWMIVTREADKGIAVLWYKEWLWQQHRTYRCEAGIGNEENDAPMLNAVDMPFIVRNQSGYAPTLADIPNAYLLQSEGTFGWGEMITVLDALPKQSHSHSPHQSSR